MAALVLCWLFGARLLNAGYEELAFFRSERPDMHETTDVIASVDARDAAFAAGERWLTTRIDARKREMPFGVASLLLGGTMVLLAARSMAGREGSRRALLQVVIVQAALVIAAFALTRDVTRAEMAFFVRLAAGANAANAASYQVLNDPAVTRSLELVVPLLVLFVKLAFSALIVVALTRPRARAFFQEPAAGPGPLGQG
jgi:hypothetical protein